jgi:hypothetical protein
MSVCACTALIKSRIGVKNLGAVDRVLDRQIEYSLAGIETYKYAHGRTLKAYVALL